MPILKKIIQSACLTTLTFTVASSLAAPIVIDTKDAQIIVVRPIDQYGIGEKRISEKQLEKHQDKAYAFAYYLGPIKEKNYVKATDNENQIVAGVLNIAKKYGFVPNNGNLWNTGTEAEVFSPVTLSPADANQFTVTQNTLWVKKVLAMGNPKGLEKKAADNQSSVNTSFLIGFAGGAILGGIGGSAINSQIINGSTGAVIGSQLGSSTSFIESHKDTLNFNKLPIFDYSKYKSVDIYKTSLIGYQRSGNIIIAYKTEKTDQNEQDALIAAIPVLLGFDETVDQIKAARAQDLAERQEVWDEYIAKNNP